MTKPTDAYLRQLYDAHVSLAHPTLVDRGALPPGPLQHDEGTKRDTVGGIDYTIVTPDGPVHVALRCRTDHDWRSVTIRQTTGHGSRDTEFNKRARAVLAHQLRGALTQYPALTVQDHYTPDLSTWRASMVVRTDALFRHIVRNPDAYLDGHDQVLCTCVTGPHRNGEDGALFYAVEWDQATCADDMGMVRVTPKVVHLSPPPAPPDPDPQLDLWA